LEKTLEADIPTLRKTGHFYFALTRTHFRKKGTEEVQQFFCFLSYFILCVLYAESSSCLSLLRGPQRSPRLCVGLFFLLFSPLITRHCIPLPPPSETTDYRL